MCPSPVYVNVKKRYKLDIFRTLAVNHLGNSRFLVPGVGGGGIACPTTL